jgi:hypothetical protein
LNLNFLISSRRSKVYIWISQKLCCQKEEIASNHQFTNGGRMMRDVGGLRNLNQNYNSMRTFTTSLTVSSRHSTCLNLNPPHRVVIVEQENVFLAKPNEVRRDGKLKKP